MQRGKAAIHVPDDKNLLVQKQAECACFPCVCSCQIYIAHLLLQFQMSQSSITYCALGIRKKPSPTLFIELFRTLTMFLQNTKYSCQQLYSGTTAIKIFPLILHT